MADKVYYPELDGLRFLAFLAVFIHHGPVIDWVPGYQHFRAFGWVGVDLFLCLSAFLFVHLLHMEWDKTKRINIPYFYVRRSLRIWPVYFLFVGVMALLTYFPSGLAGVPLLRFWGLLTFTDNLLAVFYSFNPIHLIDHLWTISYEEQFYAVIPWFLRAMFPRKISTQGIVLGMIFVIGTVIRAVFIFFNVRHPAIWVLPVTHFESILVGLCIGLGILDPLLKRVPRWVTGLAGILLLLAVTWLPNIYTISWSLMILYPFVGCGIGLIVYTVLRSQHSRTAYFLRLSPLVYLGKISYGLYLYHKVGLDLAAKAAAQLAHALPGAQIISSPVTTFLAAITITIGIGALSYTLIERPFLRMKSKFTIVQSRAI